MQIILGPFHPHLETALAEEILQHKKADPFCPLLLLVPSDALRRRLKVLLSRERNLCFINLQLLTFHQLALRLVSEAHGADTPTLHEDLLSEEMLRQIIRTKLPGTESFAGIEQRSGGCAALWQTLRDLRDSSVDPAVALEALREGHFAQRTSQRTSDLLALFQTVLNFRAEKDIHDNSDLHKEATRRVSGSPFLRQFARIFYYGFYDLTQIQLDFFHTVSQNCPTTLFFPLLSTTPPHDGWSFAERFYQRYVQGRAGSETTRSLVDDFDGTNKLSPVFRIFDQEPRRLYQPLSANWHCLIFNTFGIHDEISVVAKEILRLAGDGMALDQIGVVARSLDSYGATIKEIFSQHRIPIAGRIEEPLVQFPLTKAALLLLNLPAKDYLRSHVIDLLSSPYFQLTAAADPLMDFRPDLWDLATRELAICKGLQEWQRLNRYANKDLVLRQISADDEPRTITVPAAQLRALATVLNRLGDDLTRLPAHASWSHYSKLWQELLEKYLAVTTETLTELNSPDTLVRNQIVSTLEQIASLDVVEATVSLDDFSQTFQHWLERAAVVTTNPNVPGVTVLNATAARGLSYRALFIVGMNEGVFPRSIREDAFLRDHDREVLERDLGYKISQKLVGYDEEKLIFALLLSSTRERLYCSFQRSDESGRVLAPSWYLTELKRALEENGTEQVVEHTFPRSLEHKAASKPFDREDLLLPEELAIRLSLTGKDAQSLIEQANLSPRLFEQGVRTIERIDLSSERLDVFDGMIASPAGYWRHVSERGLSPTALELYARCPFQYFARQVLGLERLETPEAALGPSLAEFGELGHLILKLTYQDLIRLGHFTSRLSPATIDTILTAAAESAFKEYETNNPIGYPLIWETLRETLTELIRNVLTLDLKELTESGYLPVDLESDITDKMPADWPEPLNGLTIRGRMDRIDIDQAHNRTRVVDYKFKFGSKPSPEDNNLCRAALRAERLQPPFYSLLGKTLRRRVDPECADTEIEASFYYIASRWNEGPLVTRTFDLSQLTATVGEGIKATIAQLARGIQSGNFFIQKGEHCGYCEVAEICRKNHPPSLWRAENDAITAAHRQLRDKDIKKL